MTATKRPYTGLKEGYAKGRRPGLEHFAHGLEWITAGAVWVNGTYGIRTVRGGNTPSVHCTGRAADISFAAANGHKGMSHAKALEIVDSLILNADEFGIELVIDYATAGKYGGGRVWMCDRNAWADAARGTIHGGGLASSQWFHVELDPKHADDPKLIDKAWPLLLGTKKAPAKKSTTP